MSEEQTYPRELDAILTDAVDRQLAEQRALREALEELRQSVEAIGPGTSAAPVDLSVVEHGMSQLASRIDQLASQPGAHVDLSGLEQRLLEAVRTISARPEQPPIDLGGLEQPMLQAMRDLDVRSTQAPIDLPGLEERIRGIIEVNIHSADENIRSTVQGSILGATETTFASLSEQLRALREALVPRLEHAVAASDAVRAVWEEMGAVRQLVGGVSTDVEGIAQALIDFNGGLRQWATGLEDNISAIRRTVGDLQSVSFAPSIDKLEEATATGDGKQADQKRRGRKGKGRAGEPATAAVPDERIKETAELSAYLADQIEDLDGVMAKLGELPQQLEGTVSQALRRTLTARAKLDREAETALDDVLASLDDHVNQLTALLERFDTEEDHIRKLALEQVELGSRIESLQESFLNRLETLEAERRHGEEALAIAIDRSHRGLAPKAVESLAKPAKRVVRSSRTTERKPKPAARAKAPAAKASKKAKAASRQKRSTGRRGRRNFTPLSEQPLQADDDSLA